MSAVQNATQSRALPSLAGQDWLSAASTQAVFRAIEAGGAPVRAVGGAVRNALIGEPVADVDLCTPALPEEVSRLAAAACLQVIPTGLKHGTVTVVAGHHPFEVTTLRRDVETHGRHATVEFTDDWEADARRRDFTINALYCARDGTLHDPLGGYADVLDRRIRFIGDARERIREDYLRILRFFRFGAQYGRDAPDRDSLHACVVEREGLRRLSAERVHQELSRLLTARGAVAAIEAMQGYGLLDEVLPVAPRPGLLARLAAIEAAQRLDANSALRLAALAVEIPEDAERIAVRLKLSGDERDTLARAAHHRVRALGRPPTPAAARALLYRLGADAYQDTILVSWVRKLTAASDDTTWSEALSLPSRWTSPTLPVGGDDVMARGVEKGRKVGEILRALEAWWIDHDFAPGRDALLKHLDTLL